MSQPGHRGRALRDLAKNYRRQVVKKGYKNIIDRLERDCFFHFNCPSQNLTPDASLS